MNREKQKLLIEYLLSSGDIFTITNNIVNFKYFDPEFRSTIKFIKKYYEQYRAIPDLDQVYAESDVQYKLHELTRDKSEYCIYEIEEYCKHKAIEHAILASADLLESGDHGTIEKLIKEAMLTAVHRSIGTSYFEDPEAMLNDIIDQPPIPTKYKMLDQYLNGGPRRQEFILVSANSGGGKSLVMANFGVNFAEQGLNVLYISLELPVTMIYKRLTSMITGVAQQDIEGNKEEVVVKIRSAGKTMGDLYIEQMPIGTNANNIRAFLKEFEIKRKCIPDVLIVDYLDLMGTNEGIKSENVFQKDKAAAEELRQIIVDFNMICVTASQQNRCLALDTMVQSDRGLMQIKDVRVGDRLFNGVTYNTVTEVFPISKQKVYKIITASGKTIVCGGNHRFVTYTGADGTIGDGTIQTHVPLIQYKKKHWWSFSKTATADRIEIIYEVLEDEYTIDINLDGDRLFLANGIVTHNCAVDAKELNHSHIAGGIGKISTADVYLSIIFTDLMRQQGEMCFQLLKTRSSSGVGNVVPLIWDNTALRVRDPKVGSSGVPTHKFAITNNELKSAQNEKKNKLLAMFGDL
jgi:archaellum biogenesis ATPase FlaH